MGQRDILTKKLMQDPVIFADFFNGYIYHGKEIIQASALSEIDTTEIAVIPNITDNQKFAVQKIRDILKQAVLMHSDSIYYLLLGLENQSDIHYAMPVRNMLFDALLYSEQVDNIAKNNRKKGICNSKNYLSGITKGDKLIPIVSVTLYWGTDPWDAPTTLQEMLLPTDKSTRSLLGDYNCNLFSIVDAQDFPKYKTELEELFQILNIRNQKDRLYDLVHSKETYRHISKDTAMIIQEFANIKLPKENEKGDYNMCIAVDDLIEKSMVKGADSATIEHIQSFMTYSHQSANEIMDILAIPAEKRNYYLQQLNK